jgi:hypothetical protein
MEAECAKVESDCAKSDTLPVSVGGEAVLRIGADFVFYLILVSSCSSGKVQVSETHVDHSIVLAAV